MQTAEERKLMDNSFVITLVLIAIVVGLWLLLKSRQSGPSHACPHCGSKNLTEIKRDTLSTRTVEQHGGGLGGGGDIRLQSEEAVTYRCNDCNQTSTVTLRRTN